MRKIIKLINFFDLKVKKNLIFLCILILFTSFLQLLGLSSMIPAIAILSNDSLIFDNKFLNLIYTFLEFSEVNSFKIFVICISCIFIFITVLVNFITIYLQNKFVALTYFTLETSFVKNYLNSTYSFFKKKRSSEILLMVNQFLPQFKNCIVGNLINIYSQIIMLFYILIALLIWNTKITFFLIIILGFFYIIFYFVIQKRLKRIGDNLIEISLEKNKYAFDSLNNFKFLQFIKNPDFYIDNFKHKSNNEYKISLRNIKLMSLPKNFLELILFCGAMILALFIFLINEGGESHNSFLSLSVFAIATVKALPACNQIFLNFYNLKLYLPVLDRVINEKNELEKNIKKINYNNEKLKFKKDIVFENINFKHLEGDFSLNNISLSIQKNTIIGVMGKSGSGKTTLIDVLCGLHNFESGSIFIDGKRHEKEQLNLLRKSISYVPQDIFLADATIKQNIAIANDKNDINFERVIEVAKKAEIYDYIMSLDKKFETTVGEQGDKLSGGQKQRLGIARALYQQPEIIIFDESTSALDFATEKSFLNTMKNLKKNITCIFVSHKIHSMEICDKIIYLQDGKKIYSGNQKELKEKFFNNY